MNSFLMALSVVGPLMVYMLTGRFIRAAHMFSRENFRDLNQLLFRLFIPFTLFFNIYNADMGKIVQPRLFLLIEVLLVAFCVSTWFILKPIIKDRADLATVSQGIFRSNFVLFGGMMAETLCSNEGVALASAAAAIVVPTINIGGVVVLELARGGRLKLSALALRILKNPLVEAAILGIIFNFLSHSIGIRLPKIVIDPLMNLGKAATPLALVALGGLLSFDSMRKHIKHLTIACFGRLILVPAIAVFIGILMGYRADELVVILAAFASPTAVSSAPMAQAMGGNGDLAGEIVATTTVASILTIFVFVYTLSRFGFI